jgi:hypothetical protein
MNAVGSRCMVVKGSTGAKIKGQDYGTGQLFSLYSKWFFKTKTKPVPTHAHKEYRKKLSPVVHCPRWSGL